MKVSYNIICTIDKPNRILSSLGFTPRSRSIHKGSPILSAIKGLIQKTVEAARHPDSLFEDKDDIPVQVDLLHPAQVDRLPLLELARHRSPQDSSLLAPFADEIFETLRNCCRCLDCLRH